ncbi:hypothetical protein GCM10010358_48940 [Streptomyces minutiscleroticus]|uniref:Uncharacterized protein n=1 Tax=Streptomyces minutiscleroticus TaxID=68238 RepID=A0A918NR25_9ACTN|nr:hypothetical protein GCM10010358_48940 [Streptomyces minutiscleroticus]
MEAFAADSGPSEGVCRFTVRCLLSRSRHPLSQRIDCDTDPPPLESTKGKPYLTGLRQYGAPLHDGIPHTQACEDRHP